MVTAMVTMTMWLLRSLYPTLTRALVWPKPAGKVACTWLPSRHPGFVTGQSGTAHPVLGQGPTVHAPRSTEASEASTGWLRSILQGWGQSSRCGNDFPVWPRKSPPPGVLLGPAPPRSVVEALDRVVLAHLCPLHNAKQSGREVPNTPEPERFTTGALLTLGFQCAAQKETGVIPL